MEEIDTWFRSISFPFTVQDLISSLSKIDSELEENNFKPGQWKRVVRTLLTTLSNPSPINSITYSLAFDYLQKLIIAQNNDNQIDATSTIESWLQESLAPKGILTVPPYTESRTRCIKLCLIVLENDNEIKNLLSSNANNEELLSNLRYKFFIQTIASLSQKAIGEQLESTKNLRFLQKEFIQVVKTNNKIISSLFHLTIPNSLTNGAVIILLFSIKNSLKFLSNEDLKLLNETTFEMLKKRLSTISKQVPELTNPVWQQVTHDLSLSQWSNSSSDIQYSPEAETFENFLLKALKKSPESFSHSFYNLFSKLSTQIELSEAWSTQLFPLFIRILKSEDYNIKNTGLNLISSFISKINKFSILLLLVGTLVDGLIGKTLGSTVLSPPNLQTKLAILTSLNSILEFVKSYKNPNLIVSELETSLTSLFFTYFEKEKDINLFSINGQILSNILSLDSILSTKNCYQSSFSLVSSLFLKQNQLTPSIKTGLFIAINGHVTFLKKNNYDEYLSDIKLNLFKTLTDLYNENNIKFNFNYISNLSSISSSSNTLNSHDLVSLVNIISILDDNFFSSQDFSSSNITLNPLSSSCFLYNNAYSSYLSAFKKSKRNLTYYYSLFTNNKINAKSSDSLCLSILHFQIFANFSSIVQINNKKKEFSNLLPTLNFSNYFQHENKSTIQNSSTVIKFNLMENFITTFYYLKNYNNDFLEINFFTTNLLSIFEKKMFSNYFSSFSSNFLNDLIFSLYFFVKKTSDLKEQDEFTKKSLNIYSSPSFQSFNSSSPSASENEKDPSFTYNFILVIIYNVLKLGHTENSNFKISEDHLLLILFIISSPLINNNNEQNTYKYFAKVANLLDFSKFNDLLNKDELIVKKFNQFFLFNYNQSSLSYLSSNFYLNSFNTKVIDEVTHAPLSSTLIPAYSSTFQVKMTSLVNSLMSTVTSTSTSLSYVFQTLPLTATLLSTFVKNEVTYAPHLYFLPLDNPLSSQSETNNNSCNNNSSSFSFPILFFTNFFESISKCIENGEDIFFNYTSPSPSTLPPASLSTSLLLNPLFIYSDKLSKFTDKIEDGINKKLKDEQKKLKNSFDDNEEYLNKLKIDKITAFYNTKININIANENKKIFEKYNNGKNVSDSEFNDSVNNSKLINSIYETSLSFDLFNNVNNDVSINPLNNFNRQFFYEIIYLYKKLENYLKFFNFFTLLIKNFDQFSYNLSPNYIKNIVSLIYKKFFLLKNFLSFFNSPLLINNVLNYLSTSLNSSIEISLKENLNDFISSLRILYYSNDSTLTLSTPIFFFNNFLDWSNELVLVREFPTCLTHLIKSLNILHQQLSNSNSVEIIYLTTFYTFFYIVKKVSSISASVNVDIIFSLFRSIWPSYKQLLNYYNQKKKFVLNPNLFLSSYGGFRSIINEFFNTIFILLERFPKVSLGCEEFFLAILQDICPLLDKEWNSFYSPLGLLNKEEKVRLVCSNALISLTSLQGPNVVFNISDQFDALLWMIKFDISPQIKSIMNNLWGQYPNSFLSKDIISIIFSYLKNKEEFLRLQAAAGLAASLNHYFENDLSYALNIIDEVKKLYIENQPIYPTKEEEMIQKRGNKNKEIELIDNNSHIRLVVATFFLNLATTNAIPSSVITSSSIIEDLLNFLLSQGVIDYNTEVRKLMSNAVTSIISTYGREITSKLIQFLETSLSKPPAKNEKVSDSDFRKASCAIGLGSVAKFLDKTDPFVLKILNLLVETLKIPSETVQIAVSDCIVTLATLMKTLPPLTEGGAPGGGIDVVVETLMTTVFTGSTYGDRRGAAMGVAAIVKGLGIPSLKNFNIINRIKDALVAPGATVNSVIIAREGSLHTCEFLSKRLGLLLEPYTPSLINPLLQCLGASNSSVREAARSATGVIISGLSAHGVKQTLNPVINSLTGEGGEGSTSSNYKSRQEAIKMLGLMANCAPKQIGLCLPQIVPCLVNAGTDPHPKVREAAKQSLSEISSVIRNPEIANLSPILLQALADPSNKSKDALDALLECEFMHSIDPPSLALVMPILSRSLKDRGADLKRKASAITGNIITMVSEPKSLVSYLGTILPGLKDCLVNPIPDVRASSSKALGAIYNGIGDINSENDDQLKEILNWLLTTLKSDESPVERSGAAQGLASICGSTTVESKRDSIINWVLGFKSNLNTSAREGMMWFLSFLPYTLKEKFSVYIPDTLPLILQGLSDSNEGVREVSMRAGKVVVAVLGLHHAMALAPALLSGIYEGEWRIRLHSLQLLGELLYLIGEAKPNNSANLEDIDEEVEDNSSSSKVINNIKESIGINLTHEVLVSVYIARTDVSNQVRQLALSIWKVVVPNTPRTLIEIMPCLVNTLVGKLSSDEEDLRHMAGRSIGELVVKLGDRVLPNIVKPLEDGMMSEKIGTRMGVCMGLGEVLSSCTKRQAYKYMKNIVSAVHVALCDEDDEVVNFAAVAFVKFYKTVGVEALHEVLPILISDINNEEKEDQDTSLFSPERALKGIRAIAVQKPREILEHLLPSLLDINNKGKNITISSARIAETIISVGASSLHYHLSTCLPILIEDLRKSYNKIQKLEESRAEGSLVSSDEIVKENNRINIIKSTVSAFVCNTSAAGISTVVSELGKLIDHETDVFYRTWGVWLVSEFFAKSTVNYLEYIQVILKYVLTRIADADIQLVTNVRDVFVSLISKVKLDDLLPHVEFLQNYIASSASAARHRTNSHVLKNEKGEIILPIFTIPKSLDPFITIFLHGLLHGTSSNMRESSADMIGELCGLASFDVLKPTLIKAVGPLIRVIGERYPSTVKASILKTLGVLMDKGGAGLKAFAPQLQTTFVKSLTDPLREVRTRAIYCLSKLIEINLRVDPLLSELSTLTQQMESIAIKQSILEGMHKVLKVGVDKASPATLEKVISSLKRVLYDSDISIHIQAGKNISLISQYLSNAQIIDILLDFLGTYSDDDEITDELPEVISSKVIGIAAVLQGSKNKNIEYLDECVAFLKTIFRADSRTTVLISLANAVSFLVSIPKNIPAENKPEYRTFAQNMLKNFTPCLKDLYEKAPMSDVKCAILDVIRAASKSIYLSTCQYMEIYFEIINKTLNQVDLKAKFHAELAFKYLCKGPSNSLTTGSPAFKTFISNKKDLHNAIRSYYTKIISQMDDNDSENEF